MKPYQLPQRIIDLANEYDESKHPRAEDGKWTSGGGSVGGGAAKREKAAADAKKYWSDTPKVRWGEKRQVVSGDVNQQLSGFRAQISADRKLRGTKPGTQTGWRADSMQTGRDGVRALHAAAIMHGLKYNRTTHLYE